MFTSKLICRLLTRTYVLYLGLTALSANGPIIYCPWSEISRLSSENFWRPFVRRMPILYRLDAWSQYDNPEEGNAREGDIKEIPDSRKTFTTEESLLWPEGIVRYFVEKTIANDPKRLAILHEAMENIMALTCVRFIRIYPDKAGEFPNSPWVNITGSESGCFSDLGRTEVSPSNLNLEAGKCFRTKGHALHEILHTLGAFHEHMRPDRDQYIKIIWNNIKTGDEFNFRIMDDNSVTTYGLPYDYESVMHYSMTAFSKFKSVPTIVPRKANVEIGQRSHLSYYDIQKLLITYECNEQKPYVELDGGSAENLNELENESDEIEQDFEIEDDEIPDDYLFQNQFSFPFHSFEGLNYLRLS